MGYLYAIALAVFCAGVAAWIPYRVWRHRLAGVDGTASTRPTFGLADGLAYFCLNMVVYLLTAPYLQGTFGLWGLIGTEALLLLPALVMPRLVRVKPRDFFQLRFPTTRHTAGGVFLWFGTLLGASLGTTLLLMIFPSVQENVDQLSDFISSDGLTLALAATVFAPAVCEEMFHRGVLLASMRGRFKDSFIVVVAGLLFGVFHLDPARFLSTALLGMALAYAALRARSILLPMLLHFVNNLFSVGVTFFVKKLDIAQDTAETALSELSEAQTALLSLVGQGIFALIALTLITIGYLLLRDPSRPLSARRNPLVIIAAGMAVVLAAQAVVSVGRLMG